MSDVGFIGLGKMGRGMARRLIKAGLTVSVVAHRDRSAVDALVDEGAVQVSSKIQMVETCPTILTCVSDATAVETIAEEIVPFLGRQHMWIDATTSDPETSCIISQRLDKKALFGSDVVFPSNSWRRRDIGGA